MLQLRHCWRHTHTRAFFLSSKIYVLITGGMLLLKKKVNPKDVGLDDFGPVEFSHSPPLPLMCLSSFFFYLANSQQAGAEVFSCNIYNGSKNYI